MPRSAKRLFGPVTLGASYATLYTVPDGTKTILRYISVTNKSGSQNSLTLAYPDTSTDPVINMQPFQPQDSKPVWCFHVLVAGETISGLASNDDTITISGHGEEITL